MAETMSEMKPLGALGTELLESETKESLVSMLLDARQRAEEAERRADEQFAAGWRACQRKAAQVALDACLVPPDGGEPTEEERLGAHHAAFSILALSPPQASSPPGQESVEDDFPHAEDDVRRAAEERATVPASMLRR